MTSTLRVTLLGTLLPFALILVAGCQNRTTDLGESANQSLTTGLQQVTLQVTGMS